MLEADVANVAVIGQLLVDLAIALRAQPHYQLFVHARPNEACDLEPQNSQPFAQHACSIWGALDVQFEPWFLTTQDVQVVQPQRGA